jgi:outer membrane receptor protein involved in Fe transport
LTSNLSEFNKFKAGLEFRQQELQMVDIVSPWIRPLGYDNDIYQVSPAFVAAYAQESITFGGMILNLGLRFDGWMPGEYVDRAVNDVNALVSPTIRDAYWRNTTNVFGRRWKGRLSPRLAIAHPVSDNQTLFFSYGHFSKFPRPQFVYAKLLRSNARSTFQTIGNPDLDPETTVAYELGIRNQITENDVLTLTAYYKDIFDYITARSIRAQATRFSSGAYTTYINLDYARSRGVEAEYKTRVGRWFRGTASLSYSIATGKSSQANEAQFSIQRGEEEQIVEQPLVWDRPFQGSLTLVLRAPEGDPLIEGWEGLLDNWTLYTRSFYQSGRRYTPLIRTGEDSRTGRPLFVTDTRNPNSGIGRDIFTVDLNIEKLIPFAGTDLTVSLEISNVLNRKNVQIINPATGTAFEYTTNGAPTPTPNSWNDPHYPDLQSPVDPFPYNPARYAAPRNYRFAVSVRF